MIKRVLLDLDGVLVDMISGFCKHHGLVYNETPHDPDKQEDQALYSLSSYFGKTRSELWDPLGYDFWLNLEPYP